jgi:mannose-6-phosphate isomerase
MSTTPLHLLRFEPIFKEKLWGGDKIKTVLGKDFGALPNCGESWEISGVPGDISVVAEGPLRGKNLQELLIAYGAALVGAKSFRENPQEFPLLIKFLDAGANLSVQVHPNDAQAMAKHACMGKTEMWYVIQNDPGANLITGFKQEMNKETYLAALTGGKIMEVLNIEEVDAGDVFYIPPGRVHTIGEGLLICEIQQTSDITYRIYDFDRVDTQGKKRELHTDQALEVLDFKRYDNYKTNYIDTPNEVVQLVNAKHFETNKITFDRRLKRDHSQRDSFVVYVCIGGACTITADEQQLELQIGDSVLIPALFKEVVLTPDTACQLLETYVPA